MTSAEKALADEPVDVDWYTVREREYAEVLPWDHLDSGLDRDWLWEDWQDALTGTEVDDCRWTPCFDCGVCPQMGTEIQQGPTGKTLIPLTVLNSARDQVLAGSLHRVTGSPETIHQRGRAAVLAGRALLDVPPAPGGTRWGLSLVIATRPPGGDDSWSDWPPAAAEAAGPGQWVTGSPGSTHLTVTYLERVHRESVPTTRPCGGSPAPCSGSPTACRRCAGR